LNYVDGQLTVRPNSPPQVENNYVGGGVGADNSKSISAPESLLSSGGSSVSVSLQSMPEQGENGIITVSVPKGTGISGKGFSFSLPEELMTVVSNNNGKINVKLPNGRQLPKWLKFNVKTLTFISGAVPDQGLPIKIMVSTGNKVFTIIVSERTED